MEYVILAVVTLLFINLIRIATAKTNKIPCKRHSWTTEDVQFDDGSKTSFMYCINCDMIPNSDLDQTSYRERFKK